VICLIHHDPKTGAPLGVWSDAGSTKPDNAQSGFGYIAAYTQGHDKAMNSAVAVMATRPSALRWGSWVALVGHHAPPNTWSAWAVADGVAPRDVLEMVLDGHDAIVVQCYKLGIVGVH